MTKLPKAAIEEFKHGLFFGASYKRPPEETQFKKGQSGNPKGRPKQAEAQATMEDQPSKALFLEELDRVVTGREGDRTFETSMRRAVIRAQMKSAATGNPYAQKNILDRAERAERERWAEIEASHEHARRYIDNCANKTAAAAAAGEAAPVFYPHPDDLVLRSGQKFACIGPCSVEDEERFAEQCDLRDTFVMLAGYERKILANDPRFQDTDPHLFSELSALLLNQSLPKRMQRDEFQMWREMDIHACTAKRTLLPNLRRALERHGIGIMLNKPPIACETAKELLEKTTAAQDRALAQLKAFKERMRL